jgi:hypothetical protein
MFYRSLRLIVVDDLATWAVTASPTSRGSRDDRPEALVAGFSSITERTERPPCDVPVGDRPVPTRALEDLLRRSAVTRPTPQSFISGTRPRLAGAGLVCVHHDVLPFRRDRSTWRFARAGTATVAVTCASLRLALCDRRTPPAAGLGSGRFHSCANTIRVARVRAARGKRHDGPPRVRAVLRRALGLEGREVVARHAGGFIRSNVSASVQRG